MSLLKIEVLAADGAVKFENAAAGEVTLCWRGSYEPGDRIKVTCSEVRAHLVMKLDECLAESRVLLVGGTFEFSVPLGDVQKMYGKERAFEGERHWGYVRDEDAREVEDAWLNLAMNAHDVKLADQLGPDGEGPCETYLSGAEVGAASSAEGAELRVPTLFPHASTNVLCDNPQFFARNAIDGVFETSSHGSWPHESWGIAGNPKAWLRVDFGEPVAAHELRLYLRADYPHDTYWKRAWVELSDGSVLDMDLRKTGTRQTLVLGERTITWLRIYGLEKAEDEGFPGLSQLQVWGYRL